MSEIPAKIVRFGVLGVGRITQNQFVPALRTVPSVRLVAAASRDLDRARGLGVERAYARYEDLLRDPDVDAVYVATHNGLHRSLAKMALESGKHFLCEKPLGRNAAECEELVRIAHREGRFLGEAFMYRHHPQILAAVELVRSGAIGDLRVVESAFSFHLDRDEDVRWNRDWGGGALLDVGCYCVNACRLFLGNDPVRVQALASFHPRHDVDVSLHGTLDFGNGRFGVISCGFDSGLRNHIHLSGTGGAITLPQAFLSWHEAPELILRRGEGAPERTTFEPTNVFAAEIADLARAISGGPAPLLPPEEGLRNARIMDSLLAAARRS